MTTPRPTDRPIAPAVYRIIRHREARGEWFAVEGMTRDGGRFHVAVCDDRREARELVRRLEADAARRAAAE